jgi:hypothetical protein
MAYAEIKKAPLDLAARASGPIGNPRLALRQLPRLASRHFGGVAAAGLTVLRFGPVLPAPPPGANSSMRARMVAKSSAARGRVTSAPPMFVVALTLAIGW